MEAISSVGNLKSPQWIGTKSYWMHRQRTWTKPNNVSHQTAKIGNVCHRVYQCATYVPENIHAYSRHCRNFHNSLLSPYAVSSRYEQCIAMFGRKICLVGTPEGNFSHTRVPSSTNHTNVCEFEVTHRLSKWDIKPHSLATGHASEKGYEQ